VVPVVVLRPRAFAKCLGDLKPHLGTRGPRMEEALGCGARMTGVAAVLGVVAVLLAACVPACHGMTDAQDSEYHMHDYSVVNFHSP
jgi:hypothetical protein